MWKADIDSAYRRVPIAPGDRWLAWVVFLVNGIAMASRFDASMIGGIGALHAWDRVGALLKHVAKVILMVPIFRYVDDFFAVDHAASARHALSCFARVLRAALGQGALAPGKMEQGVPLQVLGLSVNVTTLGSRWC